MNTIFIVLPILVVLMFDLGLVLNIGDFRHFLSCPRPVLVGLLGQILLLPLIGWSVASAFSVGAVCFLGIMLIACSPGGSSSNVFSMLAGGDVALSVSLTALSSVITVFTVPLVMSLAARYAGMPSGVDIPMLNLFLQNIVLMAVPIVLGVACARRWPSQAARLHDVLKRLAFPSLMLLAGVFFVQHRHTIVSQFSLLGAAMSLLVVCSMVGGVLLSRVCRLTQRQRRTVVIEIGMQNAAQAITVACSPIVFNSEEMAVPAIVYALLMNVILLAYVAVVRLAGNGH